MDGSILDILVQEKMTLKRNMNIKYYLFNVKGMTNKRGHFGG